MTTVLVSNISSVLEEKHLRELFACCGSIKSIVLTTNEPRQCVIDYLEQSSAQAAVLLSGTPLGDCNLIVQFKKTPGSPLFGAMGNDSPPLILNPEAPPSFGLSNLTAFPVPGGGIGGIGPGSAALLPSAVNKRNDEIARTVYVGNIALEEKEESIADWFAKACGAVLHVKLAGDNMAGRSGRFAFIEFENKESAEYCLTMTGNLFNGRSIKVGRVNNPIFKQPGSKDVYNVKPSGSRVELIDKIKEYAQKLSQKVEKRESRSRSSSRESKKKKSKKKKKKSRSRSKKRHRRVKSKSPPRRRRRRSRSPSLSPLKPLVVPPKNKIDRTGMFFDGYAWRPIADVAQHAPGAIALARFSVTSMKRSKSRERDKDKRKDKD